MYQCTLCGQKYPYLILEYDMVVCECCSLVKNIHPNDLEDLEAIGEEAAEETEEEDEETEIPESDVAQLMEVIKKIENPRLREDFYHLAEEYLSGS